MKFHMEVSPLAEKFITAARAVLYSAKSIPAIKQIITGAKSMELGAAPFLAMTYMHLQAKLGPLQSKNDQLAVVIHMAQDVADIAHELHDPAAKDASKAGHLIFMATAKVIAGQHPGGTDAQPNAGGPPQGPPGQQPPLAQMQPQGGMQ